MRTVFANAATVRRDWYVVDATDKTLGRLASQLAVRLRGKHKAAYTPHVDTGDQLLFGGLERRLVVPHMCGTGRNAVR